MGKRLASVAAAAMSFAAVFAHNFTAEAGEAALFSQNDGLTWRGDAYGGGIWTGSDSSQKPWCGYAFNGE